MNITIRRLNNYISRFTHLCADFLRHDPVFTSLLILINGMTGILYPLPLVGLAIAGSMQAGGEQNRNYVLFGRSISVDKTTLIVVALGVGLLIYLIRFYSSRNILIQVNKWQRTLLGRTLNILNDIPNYALARPFIEGLPKVYYGWASRLAGAGVQIGLIFVYGIHSVAQIVVLGALIAFLDWRMMAVLIASSILFLPIYAAAMTRIVQIRHTLNGSLPKAQIALRNYVSDIEKTPIIQSQTAVLITPSWDDVVGIILMNQQHRALIVLYLLAATHLVVMLAAFVFLFDALNLAVNTQTIVLFGAVFFLMRTLAGFIQFLGQLTRNYINLSNLANHLHPKEKPALPSPKGSVVALICNNVTTHLRRGDIIAVHDAFPVSKLDYQHLSAVVSPVETPDSTNSTIIVPWTDIQNAEQHPSHGPSGAALCLIAIRESDLHMITPSIRQHYVWAAFVEEKSHTDKVTATLIREDHAYIHAEN